ncbi:hypothetical protein [Pontibacter sp. BAB1700]|uniref:amino acid kinase family protein n=1 Tax=Pontibacter sp. BAB1700 TaxID=1144253 RepID=UPI00350F9714
MKVFKFGGASVKDAVALQNLAHIVSAQGGEKELLLVVSAMGKTTNALEQVYGLAAAGQDFHDALHQSRQYHLSIVHELFPNREHLYTNDSNICSLNCSRYCSLPKASQPLITTKAMTR